MVTIAGDGKTILIPPAIGYSEGRLYQTDIFRSDTGAENRCSFMESTDGPIRKVRFPVNVIDAHELALFQHLALYGSQNSDFQVPLWFSMLRLTADSDGTAVVSCETTTYTEFESCDYALLLKSDLTAMQVESISGVGANLITLGDTVTAGLFEEDDYIVPIVVCYLDKKNNLSFGPKKTGEGSILFIEKTGQAMNTDVSSRNTYLSYPVFDFLPSDEASIDIGAERTVLGDLWQSRSVVYSESPEQQFESTFFQTTQSERRALTDFFDNRRGSALPLWVPGRNTVFETTMTATSGANQLQVIDNAAASAHSGLTRHIYIPDTGDFCRISSFGKSGDDVLLNITPEISDDLVAGSVIQNLYFARFDSDSLTLKSDNKQDGLSSTNLLFVELQPETPGA